MKNEQKAIAVVGGVAVLGTVAAIALTSKEAQAKSPTPSRPPRPTPRPTPTVTRPPVASAHPTIGAPFSPGRANEQRNALLACTRRPTSHPVGQVKGKTSLENWLSNVAYWESYPQGPVKITDPKREEKYVRAWLRIRNYVRACLKSPKVKEVAKQQKISPPPPPPPQPVTNRPVPVTRPTPLVPAVPSTVPASTFPDRKAEILNARAVATNRPMVSTKPAPNNRPKAGQTLGTWLANVAYWDTYPTGPVTIPSASSKYAKPWVRIYNLVRADLTRRGLRADAPIGQSGRSATRKAQAKAAPAPTKEPPPAKLRTSKTSQAGAAEKRNTAIFVVDRPTSFDGRTQGKKPEDSWLTDVVYWATYPKAPRKINPKDKGHDVWVAAWKRIWSDVRRGIQLRKSLGPSPIAVGEDAAQHWQKWAIAMALSSGLRTPSLLRKAYKEASQYLTTGEGRKILKRDNGETAGPLRVTPSGLTAEAAIRLPNKLNTLPDWRKSPSRAFWVTTTLY